MKQNTDQNQQQKGFAHIGIVIAVVAVIAAIAFGGWWVWRHSNADNNTQKSQAQQDHQNEIKEDETKDWVSVTTQGGALSMKVPDGWKITRYPGDFLGSFDVIYKAGTPAVVETSDMEYVGHSLMFRASITELDDAGLGPQWASPQPGLEESVENFTIGTLQGKRYKGVFSQDLNQTLYEYVFDLGDNQKLDVVYTVNHGKGEKDDVATVEKAIRAIDLDQ